MVTNTKQQKDWKHLDNPPLVTAIFQLKYDQGAIKLDDFLKYDSILRRDFPGRNDNYESNLQLPSSTKIIVGKSQVSGVTETRRVGYIYFSTNQKEKLSLTESDITYTSENRYEGWSVFKDFVFKILNMLQPTLDSVTIRRTSIRFINQFHFDSFEDPSEYFNTQIATSSNGGNLPFSLINYGFKLTLDVEEDIYSIVNQRADHVSDKFVYIFDIDVLNRNNVLFDINTLSNMIERLRDIKNEIFFGNLTDKTLALCN